MSPETFQSTEAWPLQAEYKRSLNDRIQRWGQRVLPMFESMPAEEQLPKRAFLDYLLGSVARDDQLTARTVEAVDGFVREYVEGPGPYERGGGSIESSVGHFMCQRQFEGLFAIYEAGRAANDLI